MRYYNDFYNGAEWVLNTIKTSYIKGQDVNELLKTIGDMIHESQIEELKREIDCKIETLAKIEEQQYERE